MEHSTTVKMSLCLCDNNPGALNVLGRVMETRGEDVLRTICHALQENDIKGPMIWKMFKDKNKSNVDDFVKYILKDLKTLDC